MYIKSPRISVFQSVSASTSPWLSRLALCSFLAALAWPLALRAQQNPSNSIATNGPHRRVWKSVVTFTNQSGTVSSRTNSYTQVGTGLNHRSGSQWVPSSAIIEITKDGAQATNCQHQVVFPGNLNGTNDIRLVMPDGQLMLSQPCFLCYYDGTTNVLLGRLQDSFGQLLPSLNEVLYTNAFDSDLDADVYYVTKQSGFSQDIIFRKQLPDASAMGLNASATVLQVWTRFDQAPQPEVQTTVNPQIGLSDDSIRFNSMRMRRGTAVDIGKHGPSAMTVFKHWVRVEGITYLVEEIPLNEVMRNLESLPLPSGASTVKPASGASQSASLSQNFKSSAFDAHPVYRTLPSFTRHLYKVASASKTGWITAASASVNKKGFDLDYELIISDNTDFVFQSDTTYLVTNMYNLDGITTFEGGTVIKFAPPSIYDDVGLLINADHPNDNPVKCLTDSYRPAIFTSVNDDSVGEVLPGSTGHPTNDGISVQLFLNSGKYDLKHLRLQYAYVGIFLGGLGTTNTLTDIQIGNCSYGVMGYSCTNDLFNALFYQTPVGLDGYGYFSMNVENVTAVGCTNFATSEGLIFGGNNLLALTNSLLVACSNVSTFETTTTNYVATNINPSTVFQSVGAGNYYLAASSPYRSAGTTNINSALLADLAQKTTFPPLWLTNLFTNDTILFPQAQRDNNSTLDLGYHYDPIDYLSACTISNATLTLTNGVVLAYYTNCGLWLQDGSQLNSQGTALQRNFIVHYSLVQEGTNFPTTISAPISPWPSNYARSPGINLDFTTISVQNRLSGIYWMNVTDGSLPFAVSNFSLRNCEIYACGGIFNVGSSSNIMTIGLTNNLFHRPSLVGFYGLTPMRVCNNLFFAPGGTIFIFYAGSGTPANVNLNNVFDQTVEVFLDGAYNNNAYLNVTYIDNTPEPSAVITSHVAWIPGPLGLFYQPTNSPLINVGNTAANLLGLYHFTTQTNEVKETNSTVDIGYHYVALDGSGQPVDTDGDGVADYLEDSNGNGLVDSGETSWTDPADLGLTVVIMRPRDNSIIP